VIKTTQLWLRLNCFVFTFPEHDNRGPQLWKVDGSERGLPNKKGGAARQKFSKEPLRSTKILFCGCGLERFSPLRCTNSETTHLGYRWLFSAQYPKRCRERSSCGPFEAEHPKNHQDPFLSPRLFYTGVPTPWRWTCSQKSPHSDEGHYTVLHCAPLLRIIYGVISARSCTRTLKHGGFAFISSSFSWKMAIAHWRARAPQFFSSRFNQLIISFACEKTDLISVVENWINKENSSCTLVFSILQFDSRGKQFGSNILTRIHLSVKIKLKKFACVRQKYWL